MAAESKARPVTSFATYEDYLDSQITELDMYYLDDEELARQLVELGYRGDGEPKKREEFEALKKAEREKHLHKDSAPRPLASLGKDLADKPFLQALANREELVRNGKLTVRARFMTFLRETPAGSGRRNHALAPHPPCCRPSSLSETTTPRGRRCLATLTLLTGASRRRGSLGRCTVCTPTADLTHKHDTSRRLKTENFEPYFEGTKTLMPRPSDLSYYNWETQTSTSNSSPNFQVIADSETGLLFKNKRDRKVINVDPKASAGDNSTRSEIRTHEFAQVVLYDHMTRRKG